MILLPLTIFLSAWLLFQVQPILGRYILPWFGGSPAVWTTCLLLFQMLLLVGYGYAHLTNRWLRPRWQAAVHLCLLGISFAFLPIAPDSGWKPIGDESPTWRIVALLTVTIGGPYCLLSATSPLLQSWFSRVFPARSPYRLYALSNIGSLLALVSYPLLVEPELSLRAQTQVWSVVYGVFAVACAGSAVRLWFHEITVVRGDAEGNAQSGLSPPSEPTAWPRWSQIGFWLALSACGSVLLLATTNRMCQEVAVVPFLWVVPMALYLATFIVAFDRQRWYHRGAYAIGLGAFSVIVSLVILGSQYVRLPFQLAAYAIVMFAGCMVCHGELARDKPAPRYLTLYFLVTAAGGALGGVFVALVAPQVFAGYWEYYLGLAGACALALVARYRDTASWPELFRSTPAKCLLAGGLCALIVGTGEKLVANFGGTLETTRNFYGVWRVEEVSGDFGPIRQLVNGRIMQGYQCLDRSLRRKPTAYYGPTSGVGLALTFHPERVAFKSVPQGLKVGALGLGVGTIAAYGQPRDEMVFYEIDHDVVRLARQYFSFLGDSAARTEIVLGDARIQLDRELTLRGSRQFDVLVADVFSSDAIPIHLVTREAFDIYWRHLKPEGILAMHISNHHVDLMPVVRGLAGERNQEVVLIRADIKADPLAADSAWLLVTTNRDFLDHPTIRAATSSWPTATAEPLIWTDDHSSLRQVLINN